MQRPERESHFRALTQQVGQCMSKGEVPEDSRDGTNDVPPTMICALLLVSVPVMEVPAAEVSTKANLYR